MNCSDGHTNLGLAKPPSQVCKSISWLIKPLILFFIYGEPLRNFLTNQGVFEQIIDFGHAPIFQDADTFPCILSVRKPSLSVEVVGGERQERPYPQRYNPLNLNLK